jgi:gamma-glutamylcyclotransferase (GGCT)/AIG2-like uncharacterized protein YtfP
VLNIFVYGSLKRGFANHSYFCSGYITLQNATVRGRLFALPSFPALWIPESNILTRGTGDYLADVAKQSSFPRGGSSGSGDEFGSVSGELLTFADPIVRLAALDRLEGFNPGGESFYQRVMAYVKAGEHRVPAWLYVFEDHQFEGLTELPGGVWE